ncbi:MAG: enolase C-terminal domain-like protein [Verrucomicrobiota bacterium]
MTITNITTSDKRFELKDGQGADSVHSDPVYSYAVTHLHTDSEATGVGLTFNLGAGTHLVCQAIDLLARELVGQDVEELMANFGSFSHRLANHPQMRWLGPHKGIVHLAQASIVNACFDLWAKQQQKPLWKLLIDLDPAAVVALLDFSWIEDALSPAEAIEILHCASNDKEQRSTVLEAGYPGYDTSVGWFNYSDEVIADNARRAIGNGFSAMKLKVGSDDPIRDIRRAHLIRGITGDQATIMLDANQKWSLPQAMDIGTEFQKMTPYWIEEPMHPDDVLAHAELARKLAPTAIALGEHVSHAVLFKNFMQAKAMQFCQVDCTRVGGVNEFILVSLMAKKHGIKVVPHVGDMGQIHQHLVLFNHISVGRFSGRRSDR